ncbi:MAG: hypothetical protein QUS14_14675, partial [Pyrinomonadaceae bacterium]|nr:hypothetical protein [Pyrinomonadaceae bacterium]
RFVDVPRSWRLYTSMADSAARFETHSSYDDWIAAPIGGGANSHQFDTKGGRVAVYVHGKYTIARERIYSMIEKIIRTQRAWFNDHSQKNFTVVVAPRPWVVSGYAPSNSFVCFVKPDITEAQLNRIVAHELFHNWLPNKIEIVQEKGFAGFRFEWFSEGFSDYFARKILTESGLMTRGEFVASINGDLRSIVDNPHGSAGYEELKALADARKFSAAAKKLAYFRGALIALNWDNAITKRGDGKGLSAFIRELYAFAGSNGGKVTESAFYEFASKYGVDARGDVERYIMRGEAIVPAADAFGTGYDLRETKQPSFDIGFSLENAYKTQKISGVAEGSAAFRAGLRNGMDFVSTENSARFSNAWSAESPLVVNVNIGGKPRRIEYFPNGEPIGVPAFVKKDSK